jgi:transcriptional regulator with XRE-family HTH domain
MKRQTATYKPYTTVLGVLLASSGLKNESVADAVDLSPSYLSGIANGSRIPSEAALSRLATYFGCVRPLALLRPVSTADVYSAMRAYLLGERYAR